MMPKALVSQSEQEPSAQEALHTPRRYRFTPEQFHLLGKLGIFHDNTRYELIEGDIYQMPPIGPEHGNTVDLISHLFIRQEQPEQYFVRVQNALRLGGSEPLPDIAIVRGKPGDYGQQHPTHALLIVEVADTSLEYDRTEKRRLYAKHGIPEYWIVNLQDRILEVYREPVGEDYTVQLRYTLGETVAPLFKADWQIPVRSLFEG
ncbi:MAG: Uma2 family endonuclease [Armatimonadota bacterium]|nr:Uma2 family endonuclease [Armatimonadota bacterium]